MDSFATPGISKGGVIILNKIWVKKCDRRFNKFSIYEPLDKGRPALLSEVIYAYLFFVKK